MTDDVPQRSGLPKRIYHTKVKTGCKTCKIRRIRCDERKPACIRCVSTGRQCDGYATAASFPRPTASWPPARSSLTSDLLLVLGSKDPKELRIHRFFMEVTAPSMAGSLNTEFWLEEIPRVCHSDEAIWHAVVSLGCAHESYISGVPPKPQDSVSTLHHFNIAIQRLMDSYGENQWWRVLAVSALFTVICCLEGRYDEARMHFKSGFNLLREFDNSAASHASAVSRQNVPLSINAIRSMLIAFEFRETKVDNRRVSELPSLLTKNDNFASWTTYTSPRYPPSFGKYLVVDNLRTAIRSAESLFMGLLFSSLQHAKKVKLHYTKGEMDMVSAPGEDQGPLMKSFLELEKTLRFFKADLAARPETNGWRRGETQMRQAYLSLCLMQTTNRFLLRHDPEEPDAEKRQQNLPKLCDQILDYASKIMSLEKKHGCIRSGGSIANPPVLNPVALIAKSGFNSATRKKSIAILRRPRLEGVWDTLMAASFGEAILARERTATLEYNQDPTITRISIDDFTARGWTPPDGDPKEDIHPMARVLNTPMDFTGGREARLELRTWHEWLNGSPSQAVRIYW